MVICTAAIAGLTGLGIIIIPDTIVSSSRLAFQDSINCGIVGSVYLTFGLISIFGLIAPFKAAPILILQLTYKTIWFIGIIVPLILKGKLPPYAILNIIVYTAFIVGDLIAIPFKYLFTRN